MQVMGCWAFGTALFGVVAPIAAFAYSSHRFGDEIAWQEGCGCYFFVACLLLMLVVEAIALQMGLGSKKSVPAMVAVWTSTMVLIAGTAIGGYITAAMFGLLNR